MIGTTLGVQWASNANLLLGSKSILAHRHGVEKGMHMAMATATIRIPIC